MPLEKKLLEESELAEVLAIAKRDEVEAHRRLMPILYDELRSLARRHLRNRRQGVALDTTELVHETFIKLAGSDFVVHDRGHFFSLAAQVMRQILVDLARKIGAAKRGYGQSHEVLEEAALAGGGEPSRWLAVNDALGALQFVQPRLVRVVECRFYAGLTEEETAEALGISPRTVQRDWKRARLWLRKFLTTSSVVENEA